MNRFISLISLIILFFLINSQNSSNEFPNSDLEILNTPRPKLVVGIVVDQMRYDYLTRFEDKYGEGGFMRLIKEGFNCKNNHYNYIPTYTGPGHASIYTGTTPKYHGIISNNWFDKELNKTVYCAGDDSVRSIGTESPAGKMSPHRMVVTTFADENRLFTQMKGKSIGISLKDRGAILPAGHTANAAYWFHGSNEGHWISSSFYFDELPNWVKKFNASNAVEKYLKTWNTLYDINTYEESGADLNNFEGGFNGKETATFPYDLKVLSSENMGMDILKVTPYGNNMVTDFAVEALKEEDLGLDNFTDVLTISYSSTDYIGHNFGVNSKEIEDTYLRLDKDIERLLNELDRQVGKGNYTVFLTSDHGVVDVPSYLQSMKISAGYINNTTLRQSFNFFLLKKYGTSDIVANVSNNQIFLDRKKIEELNLNISEVQQAVVNEIITYDSVDKVYTGTTMNNNVFTEGVEVLLQNGYNQKRSGDILYVNSPATISYGRTGSTHGSGLNYDTHVPLIFYGFGINQGSTLRKTRVVDIAPTISALLGISFPNYSTGLPLEFVLD
jgi:predicted AlkP superfamily pyrophosphatase or phosphodiesterase